MNYNLFIYLIIGFIGLLYLKNQFKFNRHNYNWKLSKKTHALLNSFTGENVSARKFSYLRKIDPFVFEELLLYCIKLKGNKIIRNKRYTGDGGIDGKMIDSDGIKYLIQAKRYKNYITLSHVKEFNDIVRNNKWADKGLFIHTGKTGKGVKEVVIDSNVQIISGSKLLDLIK